VVFSGLKVALRTIKQTNKHQSNICGMFVIPTKYVITMLAAYIFTAASLPKDYCL
jgi:hypothetical protein